MHTSPIIILGARRLKERNHKTVIQQQFILSTFTAINIDIIFVLVCVAGCEEKCDWFTKHQKKVSIYVERDRKVRDVCPVTCGTFPFV